ncbi:MAG: SCO family protein [Anaerolineae bacterium]|jgi:protein SCO1|nr:SCO family protein [Anaerolineae bacterium]MBT7074356.1 SCO family protein [Anaerolineae bacterium]MBT7781510.1 SCO family protein [Anaerolineae bacterium]
MPEEKKVALKFSWLYLFYVFLAILVLGVVSFAVFQPVKVLPRITLAPGYAFTNQDGESRTSEDYRGKLTLYNFTYANCDGDCPDTTEKMQEIRMAIAETAPTGIDYALVTVSLDPERDTPQKLNLFAEPYINTDLNAVPWDFLTGDPLRVRYMVGGGFELYYEEEILPDQTNDYEIKFYPLFVLVDGWGIIRAEYPTPNLTVKEVLDDISYLTVEINNSEGAAGLAYEAAHLFRCYP